MLVRITRCALALAILLAASTVAAAQSFAFANGTSQYRVTQQVKSAREAMGQKNEFESSASQVLTTTISRPHPDTLAMKVVLDSIASMTPMGPMPGLERMMGLTVQAKVSPGGRYYSHVAPSDDSIPNASQLAEAMGNFLPTIRGPVVKGSTWADTTTGKVNQGGVEIERRVISTYTVAGDTTVGAEPGWRIDRSSATTLGGSGTTQGQPVTMDGTATSTSTLVVTRKGVFLGGQGVEDAKISIVLAANGMEIGVTTTTNTRIEKVK